MKNALQSIFRSLRFSYWALYKRLTPEQRREFHIAFGRHYNACVKLGIDIEPSVVTETLQDINAGKQVAEI